MKSSLQVKLLLSVGLTIFIVLGTSTFFHIQELERDYLEAIEWRSEALAQSILKDLVNRQIYLPNVRGVLEGLSIQCMELYELNKHKNVAHFAVIDASGVIVAHNQKQLWNTPVSSEVLLEHIQRRIPLTILDDTTYHTLVPIFGYQRTYLGSIDVGVPKNAVDEKVQQVLRNSAKLFGFFLVLAWLTTSMLVSFLVTKPFEKLMVAMKEVETGNFDIEARIYTNDEIGKLARAFNTMGLELKKSFKKRESLVHELIEKNQELHSEIIERHHAEEDLKKLQKYLDNVINSMPSAMIAVDPEGIVTRMNVEAENVTGVNTEKATGKHVTDILSNYAVHIEELKRAILERKPIRKTKLPHKGEQTVKYADLTIYPLIINGIQGAVIKIDDVTERVRLEEVMIQTEKMRSVSSLAAGMAHEINNPLSIILQGIQNTQRRLSSEFEKNSQIATECGTMLEHIQAYLERQHISQYLEGIREAGLRASKIVANMLNFARPSDTKMISINLNQLLENAIELATSDYDLKKKYHFNQLEVLRDYDPALTSVPCAPIEIEQVVFNLLKNAAQAVAEKETLAYTPHIKITTRKEGDVAKIEVEDNGPGMDQEVCKHIFEPFFSTKPAGSGTGLGLSVSYFIVTTIHRGAISVVSTPGTGTKFTVQLPFKTE